MHIEDITRYFPTGIAQNEAFINRHEERKFLAKNIRTNRHIVLVAPRRYGKTSLISMVAEEIDYPYCYIDFLAVDSDKSVHSILSKKIGKFAVDLMPKTKQASEKVLQIFQNMKPEISLGAFGQKLTLHVSGNIQNDITELLLKLDETACHFKKRAIIFIDEMQQLNFLKNSHAVEASIRHAVERSKNITYCFSGSSRHLLTEMFGDSARPLFRLCHTMEITRISDEHYIKRFTELSKQRWNKALLHEDAIHILRLTQNHPFYVNALCQCLWMEDTTPTTDVINRIWSQYIFDNKQVIMDDVMKLSLNQKKLLNYLSNNTVNELYSSEHISQLSLSPASIKKSIDSLQQKDLVYRNRKNDIYRIVDPAIQYYLINFLGS